MPHPVEADAWDWDDGNESELARHGIGTTEVEDVFLSDPRWVPNKRHRAGDWKMLGRTRGGRRLTIVVRYDPARRLLRPITGWDTTVAERSRYSKGR